MPLVSVIIPNYNHAPFLRERIESVIGQSFGDFELIILDDASTDESRAVIERYRHHAKISPIIYNDRNSGSAFAQWKKGILAAKGEWIWIAESDDIADPEFLQSGVAAIREHPGMVIFYCDARIVDENGIPRSPGRFSEIKNDFFASTKWKSDYIRTGTDELNENLKLACSINNASSCLMRRDKLLPLLEQLSGFRYHGDWFCYTRLAMHGDIVYTAHALNTVRAHTGSLINKNREPVKSKAELFSILQWLLKQKQVSDKKALLRFFAEQYLSFGFRKDGPGTSFKVIALYLSRDLILGLKMLAAIGRVKVSGKKVKPVF